MTHSMSDRDREFQEEPLPRADSYLAVKRLGVTVADALDHEDRPTVFPLLGERDVGGVRPAPGDVVDHAADSGVPEGVRVVQPVGGRGSFGVRDEFGVFGRVKTRTFTSRSGSPDAPPPPRPRRTVRRSRTCSRSGR
jgi:hypothetical protein